MIKSSALTPKKERPTCATCGGSDHVVGCGAGSLCEPCIDRIRAGRDTTTRKSKLAQTALRGKAEMARAAANGVSPSELDVFATESSALLALDDRQCNPLLGAGGEIPPQDNLELLDTLKTPSLAAMDASRDRLSLMSQAGVDCTAMGLDTADSIRASNSLEKMLSHQMAACHALAMNHISKGNLQQNPEQSVRLLNLSLRAMDSFQRGLLTLKRLRSSGNQSITIQHLDARDGGQVAIVGSSQPQGIGGKV